MIRKSSRALRWIVAIGLGSGALSAAPAIADDLVLEPSSEWEVRDYADRCRLGRTFGEGEDRTSLWLEKGGESRFVNITAIGRPFRSPFGPRITISTQPGEKLYRGYRPRISSRGRPVIVMFGVPLISYAADAEATGSNESAEDAAEIASGPYWDDEAEMASPDVLRARFDAVQAIEFSSAVVQTVSLQTGGLGDAMERLDDCARNLTNSPKRLEGYSGTMLRNATTNGVNQWAAQIQANYPTYLLRESAQGGVGVRVQINPEGRATFCEVTKYWGPAGFNDAACLAMIRHSRFYPAVDDNGNGIWATYSTRITYRLN